MIRVIYRDGREDQVPQKFLDILLFMDEVQMFRRENSWAIVGVDPVRDIHCDRTFRAPDRRLHPQTDLNPFEFAMI